MCPSQFQFQWGIRGLRARGPMAGYGDQAGPTVVLVTGGSGLVGKAIHKVPWLRALRVRCVGDSAVYDGWARHVFVNLSKP